MRLKADDLNIAIEQMNKRQTKAQLCVPNERGC